MKYISFLILLFSLLNAPVFGQDKKEKESRELIYNTAEVMPEFPGGKDALMDFVANNLNYPSQAQRSGTEGTVMVTFIVDKNGRIKDAKVLKGIGSGCDQEALRLLNRMPLWTPGKQRGKVVPVRCTLPIKFKL